MAFNRDDKRSGGGSGRGFGGGGRGGSARPTMHSTTCSDCGNTCEVPFKPTGARPVFCSNCFDKGAKGGQSSEQLDTINAKLDLIIKAMGLGSVSTKEKVEKKSEPEAKKEVAAPKKEKTKAKAKVASKKVSAKKKK